MTEYLATGRSSQQLKAVYSLNGIVKTWEGKVKHTALFQACCKWFNCASIEPNAEVAVTASVFWPLAELVRIRQLHQVDHFRSNVEPCASVW